MGRRDRRRCNECGEWVRGTAAPIGEQLEDHREDCSIRELLSEVAERGP